MQKKYKLLSTSELNQIIGKKANSKKNYRNREVRIKDLIQQFVVHLY